MRTLVIGIGNPERGDDAAGILVAQRLRTLAPDLEVDTWTGDPTAMLDRWTGYDHVVLVDAARSGARPGTLRRLIPGRSPAIALVPPSGTHDLGVLDAVALADRLGRTPPRLVVWAIEAGAADVGWPVSKPVARAVEEAALRIVVELGLGHAVVA